MTELPLEHPLSAAYVDLNEMTVLLNSGEVLPIARLFDEDGDDCDPEEAVVVVAGTDERGLVDSAVPDRAAGAELRPVVLEAPLLAASI